MLKRLIDWLFGVRRYGSSGLTRKRRNYITMLGNKKYCIGYYDYWCKCGTKLTHDEPKSFQSVHGRYGIATAKCEKCGIHYGVLPGFSDL